MITQPVPYAVGVPSYDEIGDGPDTRSRLFQVQPGYDGLCGSSRFMSRSTDPCEQVFPPVAPAAGGT